MMDSEKTNQTYENNGQTSTITRTSWRVQVGETQYPANYALDHIEIEDGSTIVVHYVEETVNAVKGLIPTEPLVLPASTAQNITVELLDRNVPLFATETVTMENAIAARRSWPSTSKEGYVDRDEPPTILDAVVAAIKQIQDNPDYDSVIFGYTQEHQKKYIDPPINKGYAIVSIETGEWGTSSFKEYRYNPKLYDYVYATGKHWYAIVNGYTISPVRYSLANIALEPGMTIKFKFSTTSEYIYKWERS